MGWTIGGRLYMLGGLGLAAATVIGAVAWTGMRSAQHKLDELLASSQGAVNFMRADMMHDAIRGDVLSSLLATSPAEFDQSRADLHEHSELFQKMIAETIELPVDHSLIQAVQDVKPALDAYVAAGLQVQERAASDRDGALALMPEFDAAFSALEERNEQVSTAFEEMHRTSKEEEAAALRRLQSTITTTGLIALGVLGFGAVRISRSIVKPLTEVVGAMRSVASGDLTTKITLTRSDEIGQLADSGRTMIASMHGVMCDLAKMSEQVAAAATQIASTADSSARSLDEQNAKIAQVSAATEEMTSSVTEVANKASEAARSAQQSGENATRGGQVVEQTVEDMNQIDRSVSESVAVVGELGKRGEQIGAVIKVIDEIADQTNLLALNAAIEAARAGEHGRGFAVVADEVRKLAERTTVATKEVADSINQIRSGTTQAVSQISSGTKKVQVGVERASQAGVQIKAIVQSAGAVAGLVRDIAAASEQQASAAEEINRTITAISGMTRESAAGASQAAEAASGLSSNAEQLRAMVSRFKL